jgi:hypothetical protein
MTCACQQVPFAGGPFRSEIDAERPANDAPHTICGARWVRSVRQRKLPDQPALGRSPQRAVDEDWTTECCFERHSQQLSGRLAWPRGLRSGRYRGVIWCQSTEDPGPCEDRIIPRLQLARRLLRDRMQDEAPSSHGWLPNIQLDKVGCHPPATRTPSPGSC